MTSVTQVGRCLKYILEERANVLARLTGCIKRQRKFSGADLAQMLVFGWLAQPDASLEMLASLAATREIQVSDTAVHKRFTRACAHFLHALLEEMMSVLVEASQDVPLELLQRFESVVLEDSSSIALPDPLAEMWQGCGGAPGGEAALKIHVRWDLTHGSLQGPGYSARKYSLMKGWKSRHFLQTCMPDTARSVIVRLSPLRHLHLPRKGVTQGAAPLVLSQGSPLSAIGLSFVCSLTKPVPYLVFPQDVRAFGYGPRRTKGDPIFKVVILFYFVGALV